MADGFEVAFTNLDPEAERGIYIKYFRQFGLTKKLYIHPKFRFGNILFLSEKDAELAENSLKQANHLNLLPYDKNRYYRSELKSDLNTSGSSNMDPFNTDTDILYDLHGNEVITLTGDDGRVYVPFESVKKSGFGLFKEKKTLKMIHLNQQISNELKVYLSIKAKKYLYMHQAMFKRGEVDEIIEEVHNKFTNGISPHQQPTIPTNKPHWPKPNNTSSLNVSSLVERETAPPAPLRQPFTANTSSSSNAVVEVRSSSGDSYRRKMTTVKSPGGYNKENYGKNVKNEKNDKNERNDKSETNSQHSGGQTDNVKVVTVELELNVPVLVVVTHLSPKNESICFVQSANTNDLLQRTTFDTVKEATKSSFIEPFVGLICSALFDNIWYRALVRHVDPLRVEFIDYGNVERVNEVREISEELQNRPGLAIRVCINTNSPIKNVVCNASYMATPISKYVKSNTFLVSLNPYEEKPTIINKHAPSNIDNKREQPKKQQDIIEDLKQLQLLPAGHSLKRPVCTVGVAKEASPVKQTKPVVEILVKTVEKASKSAEIKFSSIIERCDTHDEGCLDLKWETFHNRNQVVAFVFPTNSQTEIEELDNITNRAIYDASLKVNVGDFIAVKKNDPDLGEMFIRAFILSITDDVVYSVAHVDFGTVDSVGHEDICKLPEEFVDIPHFSCLCNFESAEFDNFKGETTVNCEFITKDKVTIIGESLSAIVTVERWNPFVTNAKNSTGNIVEAKKADVITEAPKFEKLKKGAVVRLIKINEKNSTIYVTTRELNLYYKTEIEPKLLKQKGENKIDKPILNQVILVKIDNRYHRAIVLNVGSEQSHVNLIDLGAVEKVANSCCFYIEGAFAKMKCAVLPLKLKGFEIFTDKHIKELQNALNNKEKFTIDSIADNIVNLMDSNNKDIFTMEEGFLFKNIKQNKLPLGEIELLCSVVNAKEAEIFFCKSEDNEGFTDLTDKINTYCTDEIPPYHPSVGFVCLGEYEGGWYRAHVLSANKKEDLYELQFFDYGNKATLSSESIKIIPDESYLEEPAFSVPCVIEDIRNKYGKTVPENICQIIDDTIEMAEAYTVDIIKIELNTCHIQIKTLTADLMAKKLL